MKYNRLVTGEIKMPYSEPAFEQPQHPGPSEFKLFSEALEQNNLPKLITLATLYPKAANYFFRADAHLVNYAVCKGHIAILKWLGTKIDTETMKHWIRSHNFEFFHKAAKAGHVDVLTWLAEQVPEDLENMIGVVNTVGLGDAALSIAERPDAAASFQKQWLERNSFPGFRSAVYRGHAAVLDWFKQRVTPKDLQLMIEVCLTEFIQATGQARFGSIEWLEREAPQAFHNLLRDTKKMDYLKSIARGNSNPAVLKWIEVKTASSATQNSGDSASALNIGPCDKTASTDNVAQNTLQDVSATLIAILNTYHAERSANKNEFYWLGRFFGSGYSKTQKLISVTHLIEALGNMEKNTLSELDMRVCRQGTLGDRINEWEQINKIKLSDFIKTDQEIHSLTCD